jgi:hypothetical protein
MAAMKVLQLSAMRYLNNPLSELSTKMFALTDADRNSDDTLETRARANGEAMAHFLGQDQAQLNELFMQSMNTSVSSLVPVPPKPVQLVVSPEIETVNNTNQEHQFPESVEERDDSQES